MSITVNYDGCPNAAVALVTTTCIDRADNGAPFTEIATKPYVVSFAGLRFIDTTVVTGAAYAYRVRFQGAKGKGGYGPTSSPLTVEPPLPLPPTLTTAVLS